jgi:hypothetical protein
MKKKKIAFLKLGWEKVDAKAVAATTEGSTILQVLKALSTVNIPTGSHLKYL